MPRHRIGPRTRGGQLRELARELEQCAGSASPRSTGDDEADVIDLGVLGGADLPGRHQEDAVAEAASSTSRRCWSVVAVTEGRLRQAGRRGPGRARRPEPPLAPEGAEPGAGVVTVTTGALGAGFLGPGHPVSRSSPSTDLFRSAPSATRRPATCAGCRPVAGARWTRSQLRPGDHVVHEQHGVGRYVEMTQRTVAGATREYLVIEYAPSKRGHPGDRLYVPTDPLDQVTRYVGGEAPGAAPVGGSDWAKRRGGPARR